jgi:hypothetical protein
VKTRLYAALGFVAWEGIKLVLRRKIAQNRSALAAGLTVALVVIGGFAAAKSGSTSEE